MYYATTLEALVQHFAWGPDPEDGDPGPYFIEKGRKYDTYDPLFLYYVVQDLPAVFFSLYVLSLPFDFIFSLFFDALTSSSSESAERAWKAQGNKWASIYVTTKFAHASDRAAIYTD